MIIAHPRFGLGNRLICIASCLWISEQMGRECKILWLPDSDCPFDYHELFVPNKQIQVVKTEQIESILKMINNTIRSDADANHVWKDRNFVYLDQLKISPWKNKVGTFIRFHDSFKTICIHTWEGFGPNTKYFSLFEPALKIAESVAQYDSELRLPDRIGVHIRTTDHFKSETMLSDNDYYPPAVFIDLIARMISKEPSVKFFVAADDDLIVSRINSQFEGHIAYISKKGDRYSIEGAYEALIDAYCLSRTKTIVGNHISSFAHMAAKLGGKEVVRPQEISVPN